MNQNHISSTSHGRQNLLRAETTWRGLNVLATFWVCLLTGALPVLLLDPAIAQDQRFQMDESDFDRNVLQADEATAKRKCKSSLQVRLSFIELSGKLSPAERRKLELAGLGDVERFFAQYKCKKAGMKFGSLTQDEWQKMWQEVQPLQARFQAGIYADDSLLEKTVSLTLDEQQLKRYEEIRREHDKKLFDKYMLATLAIIERKSPMTRAQRTRFLTLVDKHAEPPKYYGQSTYPIYAVLFQISKVPEKELKAIFSDAEWQVINQYVQQGRQMGNMNQIGGFF